MNKIIACQDCKFFKRCSFDCGYQYKCYHPSISESAMEMDFKTGRLEVSYCGDWQHIQTMRKNKGLCGKGARYFEQKKDGWLISLFKRS